MDEDLSSSKSLVESYRNSKTSSAFYGYVRRIPAKARCETLYQCFFTRFNALNSALDEGFFREQLNIWWNAAYDTFPKQGIEKLPSNIRCFPALIFQVLAIGLQFVQEPYDSGLDKLKFGPSQTFSELSREFTECGTALSNLLGLGNQTLIGVQQSFLRDCWLMNSGQLMDAWGHSGETVK
jgi:hypothetical protein